MDIVERLRQTGFDRDNFPRMDSEGWLPVGLAREAAAEIERLRAVNAEHETRIERLDYALAEGDREIDRLRAQLSVVMEEKQKQVDYWGDRCCKAESHQNQMFAALQALVREQRDWESPTLDRARAAVTAVEDKP